MASFDRSIDVDVPVAEAYMLFSDFESFPAFMEGVESVERVGSEDLRWRAKISGREEEWTARITEQMPSTKIAWESTSGAKNAGLVTFDKLDSDSTRVNLHIEYEPEGFVENLGTLLGLVNGRMAGDLKRFKKLVEEGGAARSGWHGAGGDVEEVTASDMMDGGQRREQRLHEDDLRPGTADDKWRMGEGDEDRTRYPEGREGLVRDIDDTTERQRLEEEPDIEGSPDRLHSNENLHDATSGIDNREGMLNRGTQNVRDDMNRGFADVPEEQGPGYHTHRDPLQRGVEGAMGAVEGDDVTEAARRAERRGEDLRDPLDRQVDATQSGIERGVDTVRKGMTDAADGVRERIDRNPLDSDLAEDEASDLLDDSTGTDRGRSDPGTDRNRRG